MKKYILISVFVASLAQNSFAASSGTCGAYHAETNTYDCYWSLDDDNKVTITGSGAMYDYDYPSSENPAPWGTNISEIDISGITSIGRLAFNRATSSNAKIGSSVLSINAGAFQTMPNLQTVEFAENSNLTSIGVDVFGDTPKLEHIDLPNNLTYLGHYNFLNSGVKSLVLPDSLFQENAEGLNYSALTDIQQIFCSKQNEKKCEEYLKTAKAFTYKDGKWVYEPLTGVEIKTYEFDNGNYVCDGKFYNSLNDIGTANNIKKRIYTVNEANKISGKKNRVTIRYK